MIRPLCCVLLLAVMRVTAGDASLPLWSASDTVTPPGAPNISDLFSRFLPSVIEAVARESIPRMKLDVGGPMEKRNSPWMRINGWIIGVCVVLGVILVVVTLGTVYFVRKALQQMKSESVVSDEDFDDDYDAEEAEEEEEVEAEAEAEEEEEEEDEFRNGAQVRSFWV